MGIEKITGAIKQIGITPNQAIALLASIKSFDFINTDQFGNRATDALMSGDLGKVFGILSNTARDVFSNGTKYQELMQLITKVGVVKLVVALMSMVMSSLTS